MCLSVSILIQIQVFRSFFIKLKNPSNVIAGNSAAVQISLFNYSPNTKMVISFYLRLPLILLFLFHAFPLKVMFHFNYHLQVPYTFVFKLYYYKLFQGSPLHLVSRLFSSVFYYGKTNVIRYPFRIIPCHETEIAKLNEKFEILGCFIED